MVSVHGQGTEPEADRELTRALRMSHLVGSVRVLIVIVVALATAITLLFAGAPRPVAASPPSPHATTAAATGSLVGQPPAPGTAPVAVPGSATHVALTATGPSLTGRSFAYGYDLATLVPVVGSATSTGAVHVAQSIPGGFVSVPIMGWGEGNPEVSPGVYNFSGIARQLAFVQAAGGVPVITLCAAPDWMKGGQAGVTDWTQIETAPLSQHFSDFAGLSAAVAAAFPQVKYFVVWNELKGFWNPTTRVTDIAGYTAMYNATYGALKAARPDALVGGPYVSVHSLSGPATAWAPTPSGPWGHLGASNLSNIAYWLANKVGADFIAVDGRAFTNDAGLTTDPLTSTAKYAAADQWLTAHSSLPIMWMESRLLPDPTIANQDQQAALRVAALMQMASSGASVGLQWDPEQQPTWDEGLWATSGLPGGAAQPTVLAQELPAVLGVLAAPVTIVAGTPPGALVATGSAGTVTVTYSATSASVVVTGPGH
jgi:hypothetical protein